MDSVEKRLDFIKYNASRIFTDTIECKQALLDSIAAKYIASNNNRYLDALATIRQNPNAKVADLYTDVIRLIIQNDFPEFINKLYAARGRYISLERELIGALNMIVNGRPLKLKYDGLLNEEIDKSTHAGDKLKEAYFKRLKTKIENENYR
jgi:hypothetical protein